MAKWRAIHSDISTSEQVDQLTEFEQLFFTWMIPHADDWGVITGKVRELKLKVLPGSDRTCQEMTDALGHMEEVGLVWLYEPDNYGPLVQFRRWDSHQPIREDRRKDPEKPLHYEHPRYPDFPELAWHNPEKPGNAGQRQAIQDNTILDKEDTKTAKRDPRLDHPAIIGYRELARLYVPIALRDDWIACAEKVGTEHLLAVVKEWIAKGYNPRNVQGMMRVAREGWDDAKHQGTIQRDEITDEERAIYAAGP
jgi:hypothetical protein